MGRIVIFGGKIKKKPANDIVAKKQENIFLKKNKFAPYKSKSQFLYL